MIGLIVVTHGNLAKEFVAALEHVVGPQQQIAPISIFPNDDMEERRNAILEAAKTVRQRRRRHHFDRYVRRNAVQFVHIGHGQRIDRSDRRGEPSHAGEARPDPGGGSAGGRLETGAGCRPEIHSRGELGSECPLSERSAEAKADGPPGGEAADGIYQCLAEVTIVNKRGLHARASAVFVKTAEQFDAEVSVTKDGQTVSGGSIMGLLMLGASPGSTILIETEGPDAEEALEALTALVEARFNENE